MIPDANPHPIDSPSQDHREAAPDSVRVAVLTLSDTRSAADDRSGALIKETLRFRGHEIADYQVMPDDPDAMRAVLERWVADSAIDAIVTNGGTGISARDSTVNVVTSLLDVTLDGFGEIFRMLSWQEVGASAMLSRAVAGAAGTTAIFALPGSSNAVRLAMERLVGPEIAHVVHELRKHVPPPTT